ncbi:MAG: response regulator, partial [Armatimonadetes bacterium]|nr:response regulator [Armatimonadota bacterium]
MDLNSVPPLILAVDDNDQNLNFLRICLRNAGYRVNTASDGHAALDQVESHRPDLILLDVMMPGISGFEVCRRLKDNEETWFIPVVIITALADPESRLTGIESGADDFITKPFNKPELLTRVKSLLRMKTLYDELDTAQNVVFTLVLALEAKDPYLQGHAERVGRFSECTAQEMGFSESDQRTIKFAGILHDIGKIGIKDEVLKKTGALSPEDWAEMKKHPEIGEKICLPLRATKQLLPIIRH